MIAIGFNPTNNGDVIIISVPALTEERRRPAKQAKVEAEDAKVGVRNARKDANTDIKKLEKKEHLKTFVKEEEVQNLTNSFIRKVDELCNKRSRNHEGINFVSSNHFRLVKIMRRFYPSVL
jgi:ribosome recycling factor